MRAAVMTFIRLGPCWIYGVAAAFFLSMVLLGRYPSSSLVWALYLETLPLMRDGASMLLALPGVNLWGVIALMAGAAAAGIHLARKPDRFLRTRFVHAHVALVLLVLTNLRQTMAEASVAGICLPPMLGGDWSLLPVGDTLFQAALIGLVTLACLCSHLAIIRRIRA